MEIFTYLGVKAASFHIFPQNAAWAMRDSNSNLKSPRKLTVSTSGAAKSVVNQENFAQAVNVIGLLPLTPVEKAEAIRRLLRGSDEFS